MDHYDLVVIGAGPAGEKAATQAAYFGKSVAIVERRPDPGGIAVSDAGIPTKTLRETAEYLTGFRRRDVYGIGLALDAKLKLERLASRTAEVRRVMTEAVRANIARMGVELIHGEGALGAGRTVVVHGSGGAVRTLEAGVVLVATGSRPFHPPGIPFHDRRVADSETILRIGDLPRSMAVVGGGAIGCEYASIFTALGVEVTLLELTDRLLPFMDGEVSSLLADVFRGQGMNVRLGTALGDVDVSGLRVVLQVGAGARLEVDQLLFAGGRIGNTEGLGLAEAGVALDGKGRIVVDASFQTTAPGIYAAGDVIGPPALASVSMEQGRVAMCHAFHLHFKDAVDPLPPFGVYAIPEIAMVGLTEEQARERGIDYAVGRRPFAQSGRARIAGTTEGLLKLVFRRSDRVLLGVHALGDIASELIHLGQLAVRLGLPIDHFIHTTFNVPTYSEAYKYAAYDGLQRLRAVADEPRHRQ